MPPGASTSRAKRTEYTNMSNKPPEKTGTPRGTRALRPDWADGLRQLYDSVVDEPMPDSFKDLLARLDKPAKGRPSGGGSDAR